MLARFALMQHSMDRDSMAQQETPGRAPCSPEQPCRRDGLRCMRQQLQDRATAGAARVLIHA
jgi:hypothetical protein